MDVTLLTCTGDRPEAFALCERWVARQTVKPFEWIVVDDGKVPTKCTMGQQVIRREPQPDDPVHTLVTNMQAGIDEVVGDVLLFWEDDDWYGPKHTERMLEEIDKDIQLPAPVNGFKAYVMAELVGQMRAVYYHVGIRHIFPHQNEGHASLCETGMRRSMINYLKVLMVDDDPFIDLRLWNLSVNKRLFLAEPRTCVGIKGMPGRDGIGKGHIPIYGGYRPDLEMKALREIIGDDVEAYAKFRWEGA